MQIDFNVIATGLIAPVAVLIVKTLLDFSMARIFVKYLYWIPIRGIIREKPPSLSGQWEQVWEAAGSENFTQPTDRHSYTEIRQFGRYCYAEFYSKGVKYGIFGKIRGDYIIGEWFDIKNEHAYFGAFQLRIVDTYNLEGKYIGHSKRKLTIQHDSWIWARTE